MSGIAESHVITSFPVIIQPHCSLLLASFQSPVKSFIRGAFSEGKAPRGGALGGWV